MKLRKDYLALVTLGFGEATIAILNQAVGITGGALGLDVYKRQVHTPAPYNLCRI